LALERHFTISFVVAHDLLDADRLPDLAGPLHAERIDRIILDLDELHLDTKVLR
jgi:hypothetical protein